MILMAASSAPASQKDVPKVFVVLVTEEDFQNPELFAGVSPLNPKKLTEVVEAVVASGPRSVGVISILLTGMRPAVDPWGSSVKTFP